MLGIIIEGIKGIIDLREKAREDKKRDLEIRKIEGELAEKESPIRLATFEEVKEFDPKFRRIQRMMRLMRHRVSIWSVLIGLAFVGFVIHGLVKLIAFLLE